MFLRVMTLAALVFLLFNSANAESAPEEPIPAELAKWKDWVKFEQEYRQCPSLANAVTGDKSAHLCAWPGELKIDVNETRATFTQQWKVEASSRVPLPGSLAYWPQSVRINQQAITVLQANHLPYIELAKGEYIISGEIPWAKRPESLKVPEQVGLVSMTMNSQPQAFVAIEQGMVWLGSVEKTQTQEKDFLKIWVNRLISDAHPMRMTVALELNVGGRAREQKLTQFANAELQLMHIQADLNTRIDNEGNLWVQLKPGDHQLQLTFKMLDFPTEITLAQSGDDWPQQEIWVYQDNSRLRSTQIEGAMAIDAEQAFMSEWQQFPHFVVNQGESIKVVERQRGMSHNFDSLSLERQMWLSFDGQSYYFFDNISGQKSKDWRVHTLPNYKLTQLSNHGKERLITYDEQQRTGAEIRTPQLAIQASGEVATENLQHASGWDIAFANTSVSLNIPPGRKLISISGADNSYGDWLSQWELIYLFFILVTVALVFKTFGILVSCFALLTLVLGFHEPGFPMFWWFNLVVALTLAVKITREKLLTYVNVYRWVSVAILLVVLLPFLADQIRYSLYPQLEMQQSLQGGYVKRQRISNLVGEVAQFSGEPFADVALESVAEPSSVSAERDAEQKITITGSRIKRSDVDNSYEQDAVIQAGKGKPSWQWQNASYSWNGPVDSDDKVSLVILPETGVKIFRISLMLLCVFWLLLMLLKSNSSGSSLTSHPWLKRFTKNVTAQINVLVLMGIALGSVFSPSASASEFPDQHLLQQLQQRIYPKPVCEPECVSLANAQLKINATNLELQLEYQSGANKAALLPQSNDWRIDQILLNQQPIQYLWKNKAGSWIELSEGINLVTLRASLKDKSDVAIAFNESPKYFTHQVSGWEVSGVSLLRLKGNSVQLTRLVSERPTQNKIAGDESPTSVSQEQSINNLLLLTRRFNFGSQWSLHNTLTRRAPLLGTLTSKIPLLSFEQPLQHSDSIKQGVMEVVIPANTHEFNWHSSISGTQEFELVAMQDHSVDESWEILVYPNWNIQIEGIPAVLPDDQQADDYWVYQYFPRAQEKLKFTISKPPAAKGAAVAITSVTQDFQLSQRKTTANLNIRYKATRAEQLLLHVGDAEVKNLTHDSKQVNLGNVEGVVAVNLKPGEHNLRLQLELNQEISWRLNLLSAQLNLEFTNLTSSLTLPDNRWLIAASGPGYGPAIIYWGELIFFALLAIGLSKLSFSPLNYWQWLILGLGMSTYSWPAMAWVAAWLLASEWRRHNPALATQSPIIFSWFTLISSIIASIVLVVAVPFGLLQTPDMGVIGNGSYGNSLTWFLDRGDSQLGAVEIISLPIWVYKALMLLWATWLSFSLIRWLGWTAKDLSNAQFTRKRQKPENTSN